MIERSVLVYLSSFPSHKKTAGANITHREFQCKYSTNQHLCNHLFVMSYSIVLNIGVMKLSYENNIVIFHLKMSGSKSNDYLDKMDIL